MCAAAAAAAPTKLCISFWKHAENRSSDMFQYVYTHTHTFLIICRFLVMVLGFRCIHLDMCYT